MRLVVELVNPKTAPLGHPPTPVFTHLVIRARRACVPCCDNEMLSLVRRYQRP